MEESETGAHGLDRPFEENGGPENGRERNETGAGIDPRDSPSPHPSYKRERKGGLQLEPEGRKREKKRCIGANTTARHGKNRH